MYFFLRCTQLSSCVTVDPQDKLAKLQLLLEFSNPGVLSASVTKFVLLCVLLRLVVYIMLMTSILSAGETFKKHSRLSVSFMFLHLL